ncbi:MAG: hypothetical protein OWT27_01305, partial [Firmicutes bacterium]|nr:hypothetical protein [Bacillota bacterium]
MKRLVYILATTACAAAIAVGSQLAAVSGTTASTQPLPTGAATNHKAHHVKRPTPFAYRVNPKPVPYGKIGAVADLRMVTPANGWAASNRGIFRTRDGGRLWQQVLRGNAALSGENGTAYFLNATMAWAILPDSRSHVSVFFTRDAGQHWSRSALAIAMQTIVALDFVNESRGFILYAPEGGAGPMEPVGVWRTTDGGRTFALVVPAPTQSPSSHGLSQTWLKSGIAFEPDGTGWIPANSWNESLWLAMSRDDGQEWKTVTIRAIPRALK